MEQAILLRYVLGLIQWRSNGVGEVQADLECRGPEFQAKKLCTRPVRFADFGL